MRSCFLGNIQASRVFLKKTHLPGSDHGNTILTFVPRDESNSFTPAMHKQTTREEKDTRHAPPQRNRKC